MHNNLITTKAQRTSEEKEEEEAEKVRSKGCGEIVSSGHDLGIEI